jgi:hypothetical protein
MYPLARSFGKLAGITPVAVRVIVGGMMFAHGLDKINSGPTAFGQFLDTELGFPPGFSWGGSSRSWSSSVGRCWCWGCSPD